MRIQDAKSLFFMSKAITDDEIGAERLASPFFAYSIRNFDQSFNVKI
jgi:hypothetical protein